MIVEVGAAPNVVLGRDHRTGCPLQCPLRS